MKKLQALALALAFPSIALTQTQAAQAADVVKNELGMITVKCQVAKTESDHGIVGYVYGNHKTSIPIAEQDAEQFVPKFGPGNEKQNCSTVEKYLPSRAYDLHDQVF